MQVLKEDILEYMLKEHHGIREEDLMSHGAKLIGESNNPSRFRLSPLGTAVVGED